MVRERRSAAALELAILGLLKDRDMHGYELKRRLSDQLGFTSSVSFGTLYPALARLEADGLVAAVAQSGAAHHIPLTGSLGGELAAFRARSATTRGSRGKKVYAITAAGSTRFEQLLGADLRGYDDDRLFSLRLAFAGFLPVEMRLRLLERRRGQLADRAARLGTRLADAAGMGVYARRLIEHDLEAVERDVSWLDRLIAEEPGGQDAGAGHHSDPPGAPETLAPSDVVSPSPTAPMEVNRK